MWGILLKAILVLLAIIGLTEVFRMLSFYFLHTQNCGKMYWVLLFHDHEEDAELSLRNAVEHLRWLDSAQEKVILCVDCGMDDETRESCQVISQENLDVHICKPEELEGILRP